MQVISVLPDLHLMMSVNSLLSPPSEASDSVPTVAIFLYRSHGYVWHGRAEIRITFTYTSPLQTPATEHIPSAWARQLAVANSLKSNTSMLLSHDYVTSLIQKVVIISERGGKKTFHLVSKPTLWKKSLNFKITLWDSANIVGHSILWIQNIHLLSNKGLQTVYCPSKCLHRHTRGQSCDLTFLNNCKALWES